MTAHRIAVNGDKIFGKSRARMSMVDGFPYKEEVGGSSPSAPTKVRQAFLPVPV
jgi:hypothetical protein